MVGKDLIMATLFGSGGGSSGSGGVLDALIDRSIAEISSDVKIVGASAFQNCASLETAVFEKAIECDASAFNGCVKLNRVEAPSMKTLGASAFYNCDELAEINLPNVTTVGTNAFSACAKLADVILPAVTYVDAQGFKTCDSLVEVKLPNVSEIRNYSFSECKNLLSVDFPVITTIGAYAFSKSYYLRAVILRGQTVCTLAATSAFNACYHILGTVNTTYNPDGLADGYIYVPRALVDTYKAATNWSTYANQFRALEDYTVDGTITGDLDESKI